jgi:putative ABC transport system permease protein
MSLTLFKLFLSGFRHYLKSNIWVALGVALSAAVLTGGLIVGDSVKHSLVKNAETRLGNITHALISGERYFTSHLSEKLNQQGYNTSTALLLDGMATANGGQIRLNNIQVWGIDLNFQTVVSHQSNFSNNIEEKEAVLSENTAQRMNLSVGDQFLLRIEKGSLLPANAPFVSSENQTTTSLFTVAKIITTEQMGRLNLQNSQTAPFNIFISLENLNILSEMEGQANILFFDTDAHRAEIEEAVKSCWTLDDSGLEIIEAAADEKWELRSKRVFMDEIIEDIVENSTIPFTPILTYFSNAITYNENSTPYSFVSTLPDNFLNPGEIIINEWLAGDIGAKVGDSVSLKYFIIGPLRELEEVERIFKIKAIVPIKGYYADRLLMPEIPGLSDSESCRDWDTGVPVDLKTIRDKDETYWYEYRGTPKAFIAHSEGAEIWGSRFGNTTAYRFSQLDVSKEELQERLLSQTDPFRFDLQLRNVRAEGLSAANQGTDFSSLFIGLSFFILVSSLLLTALLFAFNLEKRRSEIGTLSSLGFKNQTITKLFLLEGLAISIIGSLLGIGLAVFYNQFVFWGLNRVWNDIVRTDILVSYYKISTLAIGFGLSMMVSLITIGLILRKSLRANTAQLQRRQKTVSPKWKITAISYATISTLALALIIISSQFFVSEQIDPNSFFVAGGLLLFTSLLGTYIFLLKPSAKSNGKVTLSRLVLQNLKQNHTRSLLVFILLAIGTYLVVSTGMNRKDFFGESTKLTSGTGGFLYWAESTAPLLHNLNNADYRKEQSFSETFNAIQFQTAQGDDASCLNLNRISNPRILGVNSEELTGRFSFQTKLKTLNDETDLWTILKTEFDDCIPAIADQTVIQWSLGKKIGDTLIYQNALGENIKLLLIGGLSPSVFQGNVIIDNSRFTKHFPTVSGSNVFLIEVDPLQTDDIADELNMAYRELGWEMQLAAERLSMFNTIERTYLSIFLILGALGLLIGTIGLAIVLQRTLLERKFEFSVLLALGFKKSDVQKMAIYEFALLLTAGIVTGTITALISVFPSLRGNIDNLSIGFVLVLIALIIANGLFWIVLLSHHGAGRIKMIESLRNE